MRTAVAFPGQGVQQAGMNRGLDDAGSRALFEEASEIVGCDLFALCSQPDERFDDTRYAQPAVMVTCYAIWQRRRDQLEPVCMAGHSLGEITALVAAEALSFADGVRLVAHRAALMAKPAKAGGMQAILGLSGETAAELCREAASEGLVVPANYNAPGQVVVSGEERALERLSQLAKSHGARRVIPLSVSGPFHSPLMEQAAKGLAAYLDTAVVASPTIAIFGNTRCEEITSVQGVKAELVDQMTGPVHWIDNVAWLEQQEIEQVVELGPTPLLVSMVRRITKQLQAVHGWPQESGEGR